MSNPGFQFKQFFVGHDHCAMKVTTDACLFGAWVAENLSSILPGEEGRQLLDIGTGTGLLSLMVAQKNDALIKAVEIDSEAAAQAKENFAASPWKNRLVVVQANVLQWKESGHYSAIFANPPFYEKDLRSPKDQKNWAHHGDTLRLQDLMEYIREHLAENGRFYLLLPAKRETELNELMAKTGLHLEQLVRVRQTPAHPPFRLLVQGSCQNVACTKEEAIIIKDTEGNYTLPFVALLQDYYLYL